MNVSEIHSYVTNNDDGTVTINARAHVSSGGYSFVLEQNRDGDELILRARLDPPQGGAPAVMDSVYLEKTIDIPAGVKTVKLMHSFLEDTVLTTISLAD